MAGMLTTKMIPVNVIIGLLPIQSASSPTKMGDDATQQHSRYNHRKLSSMQFLRLPPDMAALPG